MFGKKKKKATRELSALEKEMARAQAQLAKTDPSTKAYDDLLTRIKTLEELIEKEEGRVHPKKDKLTKAEKWTIGLTAFSVVGTMALEQSGHIVGRSFVRRIMPGPKVDMKIDPSRKPENKRR